LTPNSLAFYVARVRGKACKRIIKAASLNDVWSMQRYQQINRYMERLTET